MAGQSIDAIASLPLRPPGPREWLPGGSLIPLLRDRIGFISYAATFGDLVSFRIGPVRVFLVNDPELVQDILVTNHGLYKKTAGYDFLGRLLGKGLVTSDGALHRSQRAHIQPAFHKRRIAAYGDTMVRHAAETGGRWRDGARIDMSREMMGLTLDIIAKTLFDSDARNEAATVSEALDSFFAIMSRFENPFGRVLDRLPLPSNARFRRAKAALDGLLDRIIAEHRAAGADKGDVLSMMIAGRNENGSPAMDDGQLRDELVTLFLAGHETTALALTWTWMLLAQHPDAADRIAAECAEVLGDRLPTAEDAARLPYLRMVISESMRLYPPVYVMDRTPRAPLELGGYAVKPGDFVVVSPFTMQRRAQHFPDPERFDPERWTAEETAKRPRFSYFPFGAGPRVCIGEGFAWLEATLILATLVPRWRAELPAGFAPRLDPKVTLRMKGGMPMTLRAR